MDFGFLATKFFGVLAGNVLFGVEWMRATLATHAFLRWKARKHNHLHTIGFDIGRQRRAAIADVEKKQANRPNEDNTNIFILAEWPIHTYTHAAREGTPHCSKRVWEEKAKCDGSRGSNRRQPKNLRNIRTNKIFMTFYHFRISFENFFLSSLVCSAICDAASRICVQVRFTVFHVRSRVRYVTTVSLVIICPENTHQDLVPICG